MMMSRKRVCGSAVHDAGVRGLVVVLAVAFGAAAACAQTAPQPGAQAPAGAAQQKRTTQKSQGTAAPAAAASGGDAGLRQRVEALEEQLVDLQVVLGTLESLAKTGGSAAAASAGARGSAAISSAEAARIEGMETQIRALTAQVEQLSQQVRQSGGNSGSSAPQAVGGWRQGAAPAPAPPVAAPPVAQPGFGATKVIRDDGDPIGGLIGATQSGEGGRQAVAAAPLPPPPPSAVDSAGAKQLYEAAYGHLLQQDYGAAESAFDDFLKRYPNDSLAGNAQYWLGESHYVRGQYKSAAGAFLKGYQTYGRSAKAPDSLLKLGMSLDRLGQKDAACTSFRELSTRFPTAPQHIKTRAESELKRLACA